MDAVDERRWHIFKDTWPPDRPWHVELTLHGVHCPTPNDPCYAEYSGAQQFVSNHVTSAARRREQREQRKSHHDQ